MRSESVPSLKILVHQPKEIILAALLRVSEQAPFYIFTSFILVFVTTHLKLSRDLALTGVLLAALLSLVSIPLFGYLSDVIGRKTMYMLGVIAVGVFAFPYFALLDRKVAALMILTHDMQYGPQASFIAENFTGRMRYSGASIGYQLASIVAGSQRQVTSALAAGRRWDSGDGSATTLTGQPAGVILRSAGSMSGRASMSYSCPGET